MSKKVSLTGDRPTGPLHLGHYAGSIVNRLELQHTHEQFILVADFQAMTHNANRVAEIRKNVISVMFDYLSTGLDPERNTFILQTGVPALHEIAAYYSNLVNMSRLTRNPTIKQELQNKQLTSQSCTVSFMCHPVSQAADITAFQAEVVPVGEDQKPLIEQTNEIVRIFNKTYNSTAIREAHALYTDCKRLPGIDGNQKASKSLNNAIFLQDSSEEVRKKVFLMYTDPNHIYARDPGKVEGNIVFAYLDAFYKRGDLQELKAHYRRGGLGDIKIKEILYECLEEMLAPIRQRRKMYTESDILKFLTEGTNKANIIAKRTLENIKRDIGIRF